MFLPGLLLGLVSCWHRGILKTVISHPSIVLLPTFTHITFASSTTWCKRSPKEEGKEGDEEAEGEKQEKAGEEPFIVFSPKFTILNILLNLLAHVVYGISMTHIAGWDRIYGGIPEYLTVDLIFGGPIAILGLLLTLLSLALTSTRKTCCSLCSNCCCTCFTLPRVEYGALVVLKPHAHFVLDTKGKPGLPEEEEVKIEETEMVDNEEAKKIEEREDEMVELVAKQARDNLDIDMV